MEKTLEVEIQNGRMVRNRDHQTAWHPALPLSCVPSGELLNLSGSQFPHLEQGLTLAATCFLNPQLFHSSHFYHLTPHWPRPAWLGVPSMNMMQRSQQILSQKERCCFNICGFCWRGHSVQDSWLWTKLTKVLFSSQGLASLVVQWLRLCLPMQGTRVRALVWEDPTYRGATRPVSHNYWACASGACAPQQESPRRWEARAPRWRGAPACRNWRKPSHRNEDPTQPWTNK